MISKEEAEKKLLKIFYDVKLDSIFEENPISAKIEFEETKKLDDLDDYFNIKDNVLQIGIRAISLEHGIPYSTVQMACDSALKWKDKFNYKKINPILIIEAIVLFLVFIVAGILDIFSIKIVGILLIIAETGGFIYFIVRYLKWKKRNLVRFKEFFKNTGIFLPEETIKKYSKFSLNYITVKTTNFYQYIIALLLLGTWIAYLSQ